MSANTVGKTWIVTRYGYRRGERFHDEKKANEYAALLAQRIAPERVEIFVCVANAVVDMPVRIEREEGGAAC